MKRAVITGGKGTLGAAIASALEAPEWQVLAPGRADLEVTNVAAVEAYFREHPADLLVCAAGLAEDQLLAKMQVDAWDRVIQVNFKGAVNCARAVLPHMRKLGGGHIIFISSYSAFHPPAGQAAYATAKAALIGLTSDLASAHGADNVRVNAVLPGFIPSRMTAKISAARRSEVLSDHQLGRFNTPSAVGRFIRHLHHELPHTSGQVFQLDSRNSTH